MLLALKLDGVVSQGMWPPSRNQNREGHRFFSEASTRNIALLTP